MVERRPRKAGRVTYWSLVVCLLGFGFLAPSLLTAMVAATIFATVVYRSLRSFNKPSRNEPTPVGASPP